MEAPTTANGPKDSPLTIDCTVNGDIDYDLLSPKDRPKPCECLKKRFSYIFLFLYNFICLLNATFHVLYIAKNNKHTH